MVTLAVLAVSICSESETFQLIVLEVQVVLSLVELAVTKVPYTITTI